ncbi:MAG: EAL domain-containing protein [Bauldia sp.]|nr:EAL domain-containing protein [Bauldia sp.]
MVDASVSRELLVLEHDVLRAVALGRPLREAMDLLCRRVEALIPSVTCTVVGVDNGRLRSLAAPSMPGKYAAMIDGIEIGPKVGSCGTAAYLGREVDVRDIASDPLWEGYRDLVLPSGYRACWSSPIPAPDGRVVGTFAFYYREVTDSRDLERRVVDSCVPLCAIVIERARAEEALRQLAYHDPLTGLFNRSAFFERGTRALAQAGSDQSVAVLCLDLDGFKSVNDSMGHWAGDRLLSAIGQRLSAFRREGALVARLGGDEFAMLMVGTAGDEIEAMAYRLLATFGDTFTVADVPIGVRASIGVAFRRSEHDTLDAIMQDADLALYRAKADGGGAYRVFHPAMAEAVQRRRRTEIDLRRAVAAGEFLIVFQPIVDLETGAVEGCEALLRWRHPTNGLRLPEDFIRVSEETGLLVPMGIWVLNEACRRAAAWPLATYVAVNVSPIQLRDPSFGIQVAATLARTGLAPFRLQLEITEASLLSGDPVIEATLLALRDLGVVLALDDFGTGNSSLGVMRDFRPDKIKIDGSVVRNCGRDGDCTAIIRAVVALAGSLGLGLIAEGIETEAQLGVMKGEGCTRGQGHHLHRAKTADAIALLLSEQEVEAPVPRRRTGG